MLHMLSMQQCVNAESNMGFQRISFIVQKSSSLLEKVCSLTFRVGGWPEGNLR